MQRIADVEVFRKVAQRASAKVTEYQRIITHQLDTKSASQETGDHHGGAACDTSTADLADAAMTDEQGTAKGVGSEGRGGMGGFSLVFRSPLFLSMALLAFFLVLFGSFIPIVRPSAYVAAGSLSPLEAPSVPDMDLGFLSLVDIDVGLVDVETLGNDTGTRVAAEELGNCPSGFSTNLVLGGGSYEGLP